MAAHRALPASRRPRPHLLDLLLLLLMATATTARSFFLKGTRVRARWPGGDPDGRAGRFRLHNATVQMPPIAGDDENYSLKFDDNTTSKVSPMDVMAMNAGTADVTTDTIEPGCAVYVHKQTPGMQPGMARVTYVDRRAGRLNISFLAFKQTATLPTSSVTLIARTTGTWSKYSGLLAEPIATDEATDEDTDTEEDSWEEDSWPSLWVDPPLVDVQKAVAGILAARQPAVQHHQLSDEKVLAEVQKAHPAWNVSVREIQ